MKTLILAFVFPFFSFAANPDVDLKCRGEFVPTKERMEFRLILKDWSDTDKEYKTRKAVEGKIGDALQPEVDLAGHTWSKCTNKETMLEEQGSYVYNLENSIFQLGWGCPGSYMLFSKAVCTIF